jgi:predicted ATPase
VLRSLALTNFKTFDDLWLPFGGLTLLSGLNGSGKSTVLQALGLLRQSFDTGFIHTGDLGLNGSLVEIGTGRDVLYQDFGAPMIDIGLAVDDQGAEETLHWRMGAPTDADVLSCEEWPKAVSPDHSSLFRPGFQFLRADRITPSVTFPKSQHAVRHDRFLGPKGEYTAHFLLEFGDDPATKVLVPHPAAGKATSLIAHVNFWIQDFSPGVRVEPRSVPMTDLVRIEYAYRGKGEAYGEPLRPTNVGFGLTHALPVVTACLSATAGSLLIVENPEAQLHPKGQAALGRLLALTAAAGAQVIVETHSDHVLNGIRLAAKEGLLKPADAQLHFFSRRPGAGSSFESPQLGENGRLSFWPTDFFDQWEQSLDKLLS